MIRKSKRRMKRRGFKRNKRRKTRRKRPREMKVKSLRLSMMMRSLINTLRTERTGFRDLETMVRILTLINLK